MSRSGYIYFCGGDMNLVYSQQRNVADKEPFFTTNPLSLDMGNALKIEPI